MHNTIKCKKCKRNIEKDYNKLSFREQLLFNETQLCLDCYMSRDNKKITKFTKEDKPC
jgi:hypothetical protein